MSTATDIDKLKTALAADSLSSLTGLHLLGQIVEADMGSSRGQYREHELHHIGEELREELGDIFPLGDLSPLLQEAMRISRTFDASQIQEFQRRAKSENYRFGRSHLHAILAACKEKPLQNEWIESCFKSRLSVKQLRVTLKTQFKGRTAYHGRQLSSADAEVKAIETAVAALERFLGTATTRRKWTSLTLHERAALRKRLADCGAKLAALPTTGRRAVDQE